jgi:hypothetical protein
LPSASRACAAAPSLSGTTSFEDRLEPAREEQSHHVVELTPVLHRGADDVDLLPEHERDQRLADRSEVEPHVTSQPSPLSELIESFQVAAATFSKTTSTPRLSVASKTAFAHCGCVV